jgi:hypothetical protein
MQTTQKKTYTYKRTRTKKENDDRNKNECSLFYIILEITWFDAWHNKSENTKSVCIDFMQIQTSKDWQLEFDKLIFLHFFFFFFFLSFIHFDMTTELQCLSLIEEIKYYFIDISKTDKTVSNTNFMVVFFYFFLCIQLSITSKK